MAEQELGRWRCAKCGRAIVAAGRPARAAQGTGSFSGPCPWECGAWINRGFRGLRPGDLVTAHRAEEWDARAGA